MESKSFDMLVRLLQESNRLIARLEKAEKSDRLLLEDSMVAREFASLVVEAEEMIEEMTN